MRISGGVQHSSSHLLHISAALAVIFAFAPIEETSSIAAGILEMNISVIRHSRNPEKSCFGDDFVRNGVLPISVSEDVHWRTEYFCSRWRKRHASRLLETSGQLVGPSLRR